MMNAQDPIYEPTTPISVPRYAGQVEGRKRVRYLRYYQNATDAKTLLVAQIHRSVNPINYEFDGKYEFRNTVRIFKLDKQEMEYNIIFDSRSPLAHLFVSGNLTEAQMLARIFDE